MANGSIDAQQFVFRFPVEGKRPVVGQQTTIHGRHDVADNLTTTEFAAAMLAARGWTNQEIGQHMNISPHTVKRYISTALQTLDISHRQELKKYMLK